MNRKIKLSVEKIKSVLWKKENNYDAYTRSFQYVDNYGTVGFNQ